MAYGASAIIAILLLVMILGGLLFFRSKRQGIKVTGLVLLLLALVALVYFVKSAFFL